MKQFLLEVLTTELETDMVEPFDYLEIRKHIEEKTNQELRPVVEEITVEAYVNEDITQEDFDAIMEELNEEEDVDECSCKHEGFELDEQGVLKNLPSFDAAKKTFSGAMPKFAVKRYPSGLGRAGLKGREVFASMANKARIAAGNPGLAGRVLTKVADSYNIDEDFEINEIIDSVLNEE